MTFTNAEIDLETLPRSADVQFHDLNPRYARIVLGVALAFEAPLVVLGLVWTIGAAIAAGLGAALVVAVLIALVLGFFAWFAHKSARVMRYALRQHDVIVQSGVFWKKETVQPIRRIQHVEQHQGPLDKRFGLYELKLFSAGTSYMTFRIPGLDAETASRIRQFILKVQEDGWGADEPDQPNEPAADTLQAEAATEPAEGATRSIDPTTAAAAAEHGEANEPVAAHDDEAEPPAAAQDDEPVEPRGPAARTDAHG